MTTDDKTTTITFDAVPKEEPKPTAPSTELVTQAPKTLANVPTNSGVEGEITSEDRIVPRLNIVGKTGDLSNQFTSGNFVLSKTHDLGKGPLKVVAVHTKKYYREATDFDDPHTENPRTFSTAEEVRAGGLVVGKPSTRAYGEEAAPEATLLLWIEKPASCSPETADLFDVVLPSGRTGTLALFTAAKTNYNSIARPILTSLMQSRRVKEVGTTGVQWDFNTTLETYNGKSWWQGGFRPAGEVSNEDAEYLKTEFSF